MFPADFTKATVVHTSNLPPAHRSTAVILGVKWLFTVRENIVKRREEEKQPGTSHSPVKSSLVVKDNLSQKPFKVLYTVIKL